MLASGACLPACGSRTSLAVPSAHDSGSPPPTRDAGSPPPTHDGGSVPPPPAPDAAAGCGDGGLLANSYLYDGNEIYRYDPLTGQVTAVGVPSCLGQGGPWTMTASGNTAYLVFNDGSIDAVDLTTLTCSATPFQPAQLGFEFGVAATLAGGAPQIFYYSLPSAGGAPILAVSDTLTFVVTEVGPIVPVPPASSFPVNLVADATGELYAYSPDGLVQRINPATGAVVQAVQTNVTTGSTWATLPYGSQLFLIAGSTAVGYDLALQQQTSVHDLQVGPIGAATIPLCGVSE